jgi:hypothetical protein
MRGMSGQFRTLGTILFGIIFFGAIAFVIMQMEYDAPTPGDWPPEFKMRTRMVTGLTRVIDTETGDTLFMFMKDSPAVHPVRIERTDDNHWGIILEKPKF